jgi:hypothetical protein
MDFQSPKWPSSTATIRARILARAPRSRSRSIHLRKCSVWRTSITVEVYPYGYTASRLPALRVLTVPCGPLKRTRVVSVGEKRRGSAPTTPRCASFPRASCSSGHLNLPRPAPQVRSRRGKAADGRIADAAPARADHGRGRAGEVRGFVGGTITSMTGIVPSLAGVAVIVVTLASCASSPDPLPPAPPPSSQPRGGG